MNLTWHIIKKDLRRTWVLLTIWGTMLVLDTAWHIYKETGRGGPVLVPTLDGISKIAGFGFWLLTLAASAMIVLEDPLKGTTAFWSTRPISCGRLLAAKCCSLAFMAFLPVACRSVVIAVFGVGAHNLALFAIYTGLVQLAIVAGVAALAVAVETLGQFFILITAVWVVSVFLFMVGIGITAGIAAQSGRRPPVPETLIASTVVATYAAAICLNLGIVAWRFLCRHARLVFFAVVAVSLLTTTIPTFWRWDFIGALQGRASAADLPAPTFTLTAPTLERAASSYSAAAVEGRIDARAEDGEVLVPVGVRNAALTWPDGAKGHFIPMPVAVSKPIHAESIEPGSFGRLLSPLRLVNPPAQQSLEISLFVLRDQDESLRLEKEPAHLGAQVDAVRRKYSIDCEVNAETGASAKFKNGAVSISDIVGTGRSRFFRIWETDFQSMLKGEIEADPLGILYSMAKGEIVNIPVPGNDGIVYVLVNKVRGEALLPRNNVTMNRRGFDGLVACQRDLTFGGPKGALSSIKAKWFQDAVLVRVRLVDLGQVTGTLAADGVTLQQ